MTNPAPAPTASFGKKLFVFIAIIGLFAAAVFLMPSTKTNLAYEAIADLRESKPAPLSGALSQLLADNREKVVPTQPHPLLNKLAPDFTLKDVDGNDVALSSLTARGPVVVVFYLGYWCDHCVSQLFGLQEDGQYFDELGSTVVAISNDPTELTRQRYKEYGAFRYPVLSDPDRTVAQKYGVYTAPSDGRKEWEAHGTFVVGRDGIVKGAATGKKPFTHNPTLLEAIKN